MHRRSCLLVTLSPADKSFSFIFASPVQFPSRVSAIWYSALFMSTLSDCDGPDSVVGKRLFTGWTVRGSNPSGGEIFRTCRDRPWGSPSHLYNGYRVFPGGKEGPGPDADPSPLLMPLSRKSRAIPLLPLWAVRSVQSLSACTVEL